MNAYLRPDDSWLFRKYLNWAAKYYDRFKPDRREEIAEFDRWFYSRRAIGFHLGVLGSMLGVFIGLKSSGVRTSFSIIATLVFFGLCSFTVVNTWWGADIREDAFPKRYKLFRKQPLLYSLYVIILGFLGALIGYAIGAYFAKPYTLTFLQIVEQIKDGFVVIGPAAIATLISIGAVSALTLVAKKQQLQNRIKRLSIEAEVATNANALIAAKLKVLQAQIKPHFLFNTLAAMQHWIDSNDPRGSILLRNLTSFLRLSSESMDVDVLAIRTEFALVEEYLKIMRYRLGEKLEFAIELSPELNDVKIPPALILTLVENAVEHGIEPSLQGGKVTVTAKVQVNKVVIMVTNTGSELDAMTPDGLGLKNSRERIRTVFGDYAALTLQKKCDPKILGCNQTIAELNFPFVEA